MQKAWLDKNGVWLSYGGLFSGLRRTNSLLGVHIFFSFIFIALPL